MACEFLGRGLVVSALLRYGTRAWLTPHLRRWAVPEYHSPILGKREENMFKNILVPLDGSDVAEVVLDTAKELGKALGAHVSLVRVVDVSAITRSIVPASGEMGVITQDIQDMIDEAVAAELKDAEDYLNGIAKSFQGVEVSTEIRQGVAGEELLEAIEEDGIDVAAIATHGRSGISRTIFGSVADQLIRESGKAVLVIKAK